MSESQGMNIFMVCETVHLIDFLKGCLDSISTNRLENTSLTSQTALARPIFTTSLVTRVHIFILVLRGILYYFPIEFTVGYWFVKDILSLA